MHKIQLHAKDLMGTISSNAKTVGILTVGTIASQKFLDFKEIAKRFNVTVEAGSVMEKVLNHQGAIKVVLAMITLHLTRNKSIGKNDLFKWAMIGVMLQGALQEVNELSGGKTGSIGAENELEEAMKKAAQQIKEGMQGHEEYIGLNPTQEYTPSVSGMGLNPTQEYIPSVSGFMDDGSSVAGGEDYGFLMGMEED